MTSRPLTRPQGAQTWITQFNLQTTPCLLLAFVRVHQMAPPRTVVTTSSCSLLLIYQPRKDERLSWPGWLTYSGRLTHISYSVISALHGTAPSYLAEDCQLVASTDCRQLRSSTVNTCLVARTSTLLGDRSFAAAAAGPRLWNSLPAYLRQPDLSLGQFRRALKTHLFLAA